MTTKNTGLRLPTAVCILKTNLTKVEIIVLNKKGQKISSCRVSFFPAGSWEKYTIFGAARKVSGPFYFVTALGSAL